jgi:hypothetical protein
MHLQTLNYRQLIYQRAQHDRFVFRSYLRTFTFSLRHTNSTRKVQVAMHGLCSNVKCVCNIRTRRHQNGAELFGAIFFVPARVQLKTKTISSHRVWARLLPHRHRLPLRDMSPRHSGPALPGMAAHTARNAFYSLSEGLFYSWTISPHINSIWKAHNAMIFNTNSKAPRPSLGNDKLTSTAPLVL